MITEDYVSFETAKLLKDKGFDERTDTSYIADNKDRPMVKVGNLVYFPNTEPHRIAAPTLQMARKWLREEHGIDIDICFEILSIHQYANNEKRYSYTIFKTKDNVATRLYGYSGYMKYEEAAEAALNLCLRKLNDII